MDILAATEDKILVESIITTIEEELKNSNPICYVCKEGNEIVTATKYVRKWFYEYEDILRKRYCGE